MSLGQQIRSGVSWLMLGSVGSRALQFAFGIALARLLVPEDFGVLITVSVFTGFAGMIISGGMGQSLIRAKDASEEDFNSVFTMQLSLGVVLYLLLFVLAPYIGDFFGDPLYVDLIRVTSLTFLLRPFALMRTAWLNREMKFKRKSLMEVINNVITGIAGVAMAWFGMGVWSLVFSGLIGTFIQNVMLKFLTPLSLKLSFDRMRMKRHSGFGFKITTNDFIYYLTQESKNIIMNKLSGAAFVGVFNKAESLSETFNGLIMPATMQPVFRALAKTQDDLDQTKYIYYRAITLLMVYALPPCVVLFWIASPFIEVVYGAKWMASVEPLRVLVLAPLFYNVQHPSGVLLDAHNKLNKKMVVLVLRLMMVTIACLIGLNWGPVGVAIGILVSHAATAMAFYYLVCQTIPTKPIDLLRAVAPGLVMSGVLFSSLAVLHYLLTIYWELHPALMLILMSATGVIVYAILFFLFPPKAIQNESKRASAKVIGMTGFLRRFH